MNVTMTRYIRNLLLAIPLAMLLLTASCVDDLFDRDGEGQPVMLHLKVDLPSMNVMTRSDISEGLDQRVETLWIGVYSAASGELTGSTVVDNPDSQVHDKPAYVDFEAKSGSSYIVGVANYSGRTVIDKDGDIRSLESALANADTWEKFMGISALRNADGQASTDVPVTALLMSGNYMEGTHPDGAYAEIQPVVIPRSGALAGSVHLRRVVSQVKFNVTYNEKNISDFEVIGWRVCNLPNQSWLAERSDGTLNAGDAKIFGGKPSYQNTLESSIVEQKGSTVSFDWWQLENKRTGLNPPATMTTDKAAYQYREQEWKDASGLNTGKYKSLVTSATSDDPNNNATYVEIKVRMTLKVDENGNSITGSKYRVFDGVYTVHLGYVEGAGAAKAMDFNARRNTKYTYDVTINNIGDVMVEAQSDQENAPGAEGIVSDVTNAFVQLDAHYGEYNIYLSDADLAEFEYLVRAYDENGSLVLIDSKEASSIPASGSARRKYLDWVEIRSTTGANVLAAYQPASKGGTYRLDEFKKGISDGTVKAGYYTVFFNEYVYENTTDGNESSGQAWHGYVNRPDRQVWIRVQENKSSDSESRYFVSKYAFSQHSIQTYYNASSATALGTEHVNESYGLNLRQGSGGTDADNGRYNTARFIRNGTWSDNTYRWSTYVSQNTAQSVNAINNIQGVTRPAATYPLRALAAYSGASSSSYDPDQSSSRKYIDARNACTNRNRDLDGDGRIDAGELRWYVPTTNQLIRIILGRRSLADPIMDYQANVNLASSSNGNLPSLLIYGSNGKVLWAMEGISTSDWGNWYSGYPWNVRCVRNLGTNMSGTSFNTTATPAYRARSGATNTVEMAFYDSKSIRSEKMTSIIPHSIADQDYNRVYKAFQYSDALTLGDLNGYATYGKDWAEWLRTVNPCSGLSKLTGTGWRIPNQKEIAIMLTLGVYPTSSSYMPSATFTFYNNSGKGGWSNSSINVNDFKVMCTTMYQNGTQQSYSDLSGSGTVVRCVRDVD